MPKKVNPALVQKEHLPARSCKLLRLVQRRVGPAVEICAHSELPVARYKGCTNARCIWKGSLGEGEPKYVNLALVEKTHLPVRGCKLLRLMQRRVVPPVEICTHSELPFARYKGCTNAMCIWKGSFEEGEPKNVNLPVVQMEHHPVRARKLLRLVQRRIGPPE